MVLLLDIDAPPLTPQAQALEPRVRRLKADRARVRAEPARCCNCVTAASVAATSEATEQSRGGARSGPCRGGFETCACPQILDVPFGNARSLQPDAEIIRHFPHDA